MLQKIPQFSTGFRFQWEPIQDCHVLLYPEGMVKLNGSAGEILAMVDGARSVEEVIAELQSQYSEVVSLSADVLNFIEEARAKGWIKLD